MNTKEQIIFYNIKYKSDKGKIYKAIKNREKVDEFVVSQIYQLLQKEKIDTLISDELNNILYTKGQLKSNLVFYIKGNIKLLTKSLIILSADQLDEPCELQIHKIIQCTKNDYVFVILLFKSIDNYVLNLLNKFKYSYILVLANGIINNPLAKTINIDNNLLISEFLHVINISKNKLRRRNVLVANLCQKQIIFNSKTNSKIIHLTNMMLDLGKDIYCFLNQNDEGNQSLIFDGAQIIY